ncbi:thymidine kinase [Thecamonas trahens ATCC 50062]|uniref:Thymidine kinase n=1 Tax=Thecamonas trahens ATCC 50062 TaxID=461836 RepID=A0A0L0DW83_THETB|nr:thymidine kinase [Thecamonas trahens ATCC 50062]KNC56480.1 thymidine kinase [Thecamonas trahens ATCC 50062]|eukprot:XP_013760989.1 thymidine kinase [Thecamonas trahens ATCC 50062]
MNYRGHIQVIFGPMFSGKSTELLRRVKRYTIANKRVALLKYHADARYSETSVATHDKQTLEAFSCERLEDARAYVADAQVVAIDEGQFFPDTVAFAEEMADAGKVVIVAALDGTFQRKAFGDILALVPLAEEVTKLNAVCMVCYGPGSFSKRLGTETAVEVIGGADKYVAVCRRCYNLPASKVYEEAAADAEETAAHVVDDQAAALKIISMGAAPQTTMSVGMSSGRAL